MTQGLKRKHTDHTEVANRKRLLNELAFPDLPHFEIPTGTMLSMPAADSSMDLESTEFPPHTAPMPLHPLAHDQTIRSAPCALSADASGPSHPTRPAIPRVPTPCPPAICHASLQPSGRPYRSWSSCLFSSGSGVYF
ncbi:hypothetical protein H4R33_004750 [Dimargaris cristalligena]|uniref:Uncharacterized protein n=1 Tax=Dimargaris cristalligena TaxID=215637 RepID=A0A4P9ZZH0_9FUNG|nr:hypothetical protein H4R33_004750 [Dimargaris cristalligena]RKP39176.1 hypothetical protein BJ085DRAFT_38748 [Dimargaris cristalligena]|eukprot:RKP39176.1 hypothetical protein BJ085DRAFT_38748 [Dimargaris cristalligena]